MIFFRSILLYIECHSLFALRQLKLNSQLLRLWQIKLARINS